MKSYPHFSIVIITYNEEHYLQPLLHSLTQQIFTDFEVVVVDANSTDNTLSLVEAYKEQLPLKVASTSAKNLSVSRNLGAEKSNGKFIFFIDADNRIPKDFLSSANNILMKNEQVGIPYLIPNTTSKFDKFTYKIMNKLIQSLIHTPRPFSTGSSLIIPREQFYKIGGYDTEILFAEDQDIIRRLKKNKAQLTFMNGARVLSSMRRFEKERTKTYLQYIYSSFYLLLFSRIKKKLYTYEMGGTNFSKK